MNFKSILQTFVKIFLPLGFGCLLLWFLYSNMDVSEIWRVIREGVRYDIILVSLLFGLFANVVRGLRWGLLISSLGERFKMSNIISGKYCVAESSPNTIRFLSPNCSGPCWSTVWAIRSWSERSLCWSLYSISTSLSVSLHAIRRCSKAFRKCSIRYGFT